MFSKLQKRKKIRKHLMAKSKYSSKFKVQSVLEGLRYPDGITAYCRQQGITEVSFYNWQKQILSNADALFNKLPRSSATRIEHLEQEIQRKDRIIAVVTEEALELKKKLTD
jgi:transposase-like protein